MAGLRPSSYWDSKFRQGPALIRARRPYLAKNLAFGAIISAMTISVYLYTIRAISQDEFEDVKVPATPRELTPKKK
jgi:cytochrome c oxidase assembly factor 3